MHLNLLPFIHYAQVRGQIDDRWYLKSVNAGFEIWRQGQGLSVHSYSVQIRLKAAHHKVRKHHRHR